MTKQEYGDVIIVKNMVIADREDEILDLKLGIKDLNGMIKDLESRIKKLTEGK